MYPNNKNFYISLFKKHFSTLCIYEQYQKDYNKNKEIMDNIYWIYCSCPKCNPHYITFNNMRY